MASLVLGCILATRENGFLYLKIALLLRIHAIFDVISARLIIGAGVESYKRKKEIKRNSAIIIMKRVCSWCNLHPFFNSFLSTIFSRRFQQGTEVE